MQERVARLNGSFQVRAQAGEGTAISVILPI